MLEKINTAGLLKWKTKEIRFPPELLENAKIMGSFHFPGKNSSWYRPVFFDELLRLMVWSSNDVWNWNFRPQDLYPNAKLVNGNSEIGIEQKFKNASYETFIHATEVKELKFCEEKDDGLKIGVNISLTKFEEIIQEIAERREVKIRQD